MLRRTLTILSLAGLVVSVGLWTISAAGGYSYTHFYQAVDDQTVEQEQWISIVCAGGRIGVDTGDDMSPSELPSETSIPLWAPTITFGVAAVFFLFLETFWRSLVKLGRIVAAAGRLAVRHPGVALVVLGLIMSAGLWWLSYFNFEYWASSPHDLGEGIVIRLARGQFKVERTEWTPHTGLSFMLNFGDLEAAKRWDRYTKCLADMLERDRRWLFTGYDDAQTIWKPNLRRSPLLIALPLWIPTLLLGPTAFFLIIPGQRRYRRRKLGLCVNCGYDLRGSTDRCPECSRAIER